MHGTDASNNVSTVIKDTNGRTVLTATSATDGRPLNVTDYTGRSVTYGYTGTDLTTVTDVLGHTWTYTYANDLLTSETDPDQHSTTIAYTGGRAG